MTNEIQGERGTVGDGAKKMSKAQEKKIGLAFLVGTGALFLGFMAYAQIRDAKTVVVGPEVAKNTQQPKFQDVTPKQPEAQPVAYQPASALPVAQEVALKPQPLSKSEVGESAVAERLGDGIDPLLEDGREFAVEPVLGLAHDEAAEEARLTPAPVELVHGGDHPLDPATRGAFCAKRGEEGGVELRGKLIQHRAGHLVLPFGEVVIQARLSEPGGLGQLRQRRAIIAVLAEGHHQLVDHLLAGQRRGGHGISWIVPIGTICRGQCPVAMAAAPCPAPILRCVLSSERTQRPADPRPQPLGFGSLAVAWLGTTALALNAILEGQVEEHRRWMLRSYALTLAGVMLRTYVPISLVLGIPFEPAYRVIAWLCWVPNLVVVQLWLVPPRTGLSLSHAPSRSR